MLKLQWNKLLFLLSLKCIDDNCIWKVKRVVDVGGKLHRTNLNCHLVVGFWTLNWFGNGASYLTETKC